MAAAYLNKRAPHKELEIKTPFKVLHGKETDLWHLCVIESRTFVHIKDSKKLDAMAWEGKLCGYSLENKSYRVWNPKTDHIVESSNVTFIEIPSHLLPPPSHLPPLHDLVRLSWDFDDNTLDNDYISYNDLLQDIRDYSGVLVFTANNIPASHKNASGVSANPQGQGLVSQIHDLTWRDLLTPAAPSSGAASPAKSLPGAVGRPSSGRA